MGIILKQGYSFLLYFQHLLNYLNMPKVVDNYVFERKIGSGQYGDVFKGYNKNNGTDIAIKAIKRQSIKGKFMELLQNEIKVLKTCDNRNIIKLYDIKKTANNFYLIIQYCNEGDLMQLLKRKKILSQDQAVQFFVQMLNAFKTLVKHKIMHRDFKLANILMHDGEIKIADFGFSKLLSTSQDFTETMLGSPLNMAPQVLGGRKYDSKADIWSLGTCFYELLFGTPPYKAANMVDLVNNIKNKPLKFPKQVNNISSVTEDVIRKMLVVDPTKRVEWDELFKHPIITYLQEKMRTDMQDTMKGSDDVELNMSKFYLKNNMVVDHPKEIVKKQNINNYAYDVVKKKKEPTQFEGKMIRRDSYEEKKDIKSMKSMQTMDQTQIGNKESQKQIITDEQTLRQKQIKGFKKNGNKLLHHRNIYVLLASVAEETMNQNIKFSDIVGYLLIRKLLSLLQWLKQKMQNKKIFPSMEYWDLFVYEKDYQDIKSYVEKQYDVFKVFYNSIHNKIRDRVKELDSETQAVIKDPQSPYAEKVYQKMIRQYIRYQYAYLKEKKFSYEGDEKKILIHLGRIIDCLSLEEVFEYEKKGEIFNFRNYYSEPQRLPIDELRKEIGKKMTII